jgi:hypothetical protein
MADEWKKIDLISAETARELGELQKHLRKKLVARAATQIPPTLYHYTDAAGLMGIVTSGTAWATHSAYLNDASEFKYAVGMMKDVVTKATADADPDSWKGRFREVIAQDNNSSLYSKDWAQDADEQQFVACFSEGGDGLSQWRGYGKSIGGYSLGFQFRDLHAIEKRINDSQAGKMISAATPRISAEFLPCWYDQQEQMALIAEGFERALRHCETTRYPVGDSSLTALLRAILRSVSSCFKDSAFKDEHEWRLVVRVWRLQSGTFGRDARERTQDDMRMDQIATVHFRKGEYSLVPYVVVPVALDAALSLSQVIVGPTPLPENARGAAMQLLLPDREGSPTPTGPTARRRIVCTEVTSSIIPFRRV